MEGVNFKKLRPVNVDERGEIWDLLNETVGHVGMLVCKKGSVRGNHYFKKSKRYMFVLSGKFEVVLAKPETPDKIEKGDLEKGDLIEISPRIVHTFIALEDSVIVGMGTLSRANKGYEVDKVFLKIV
jgi:dTDP-4-dehydrorhamnose 3,5-epimerase